MGTHLVVLLPELPGPGVSAGKLIQIPVDGLLHGAMQPFHLPLGLRMPDAAEVQPDALLHQGHGQLRQPMPVRRAPPRCPVIHQHRFWQSIWFQHLPEAIQRAGRIGIAQRE